MTSQSMSRRTFLTTTVAGAGLLTTRAWAAPPAHRPRLIERELFLKSPDAKASVNAWTFYVRGKGLDKLCLMTTASRSDAYDVTQRRFSADNGKTWSEWEPLSFITRTPRGVRRWRPAPGWVEPRSGRLLTVVTEGLLPNDRPKEGLKYWTLRYRVSIDGGRTNAVDRQIIQQGDYTPEHPIEGVWIGKNSMMIGAVCCRPITTRDGKILVACQTTPLGPDGHYHNPGGGLTYHEAAVLIGTWADDLSIRWDVSQRVANDLSIRWDVSQRVANDPAVSTRGCCEPTLAEMPDGRILMVIRGSNNAKPQLPGYKWYATSDDGGMHWSGPKPWTYTDGSHFFSPSSCSQLLRHSNGRCYWIGNLVPKNPRGNSPRYPLVIAEVDPESLLLIRSTMAEIDTRGAGDTADLQLSNFFAYEDRPTGQITLHVKRFFHRAGWRGDAYLYRIEV